MSLSSSLLATVQAIGADIKALRDRSTHTGDQDISTVTGILPLEQASPGLTFAVSWNGTAWTYDGATVTSRPTARTDLTMIAVGGTVAPTFAINGDLWLEALA